MLRLLFLTVTALTPAQSEPPELSRLVADYLWTESDETRRKARKGLAALPAVSRESFRELEGILERGRPDYPAFSGERSFHLLEVVLPDERELPVFVLVPPGYDPKTRWPMLLAMHGGPTSSAGQSIEGAKRMLSVWLEPASKAGWIVVAPAMTHVVARGPRTETRLPYEILRPDQMEAVLAEVRRLYHVDPDRVVSTGISLGSNFSIGYAASRPERFAAIVPVSTEGDSREPLLRNLVHTPTLVLEGAHDRNIRSIDGPRALATILESFGYDVVYKEHPGRAHEGFQELYPEVLAWLRERPRERFPRELLRVPHTGIMPLARRVHWIEPDTRQALVHAAASANRIEIEARWAREVTVYLHDALVDLDRDVTIRVNGTTAFEGRLERSLLFALEQVRELGDPSRAYAAYVTVPVTGDARELSRRFAPRREPGELSFWEMYATRDLEDRFPSLGLAGRRLDGHAAVRIERVDPRGPFASSGVREGDLLLEVGGEPFVDGRGLAELRQWLLRELDAVSRPYDVVVERNGERMVLTASLSLAAIP